MSLVRNFTASTSLPNRIALSWDQPLGFNTTSSEVIVTRTDSYFPVELFNSSFPTKATDSIPIELFRGKTIVGTNTGTISVSGNTLTDTAATFPTTPPLIGRLLRDSSGALFKILSNNSTSVTLDNAPANGKYVVLADFPSSIRSQQNFEQDIRTTTGPGTISNLVQFVSGSLVVVSFQPDELVNLIFKDGAGSKFIVKTNDSSTLTFFESGIPIIGTGMALLSSSSNNKIIPYIDNFKTDIEAAARIGTGLLDDQFYYYTAFFKLIGANVAQAQFSTFDSTQSTQSVAISTKDTKFGTILYEYWPTVFRQLDTTGDLQDLMEVFGFQFNQIHSLIDTFNLQDSDTVFVTALAALADQTGLPSVGYSIGIDTLRRIAKNMLTAWKLKGSKQGIALFIRILTTWDVTGGTGDINDAISDFLPNVEAFRFFAASLGITNTRFTQTNVTGITDSSGNTSLTSTPFVPGGRFVKSLPGIVIPGFFTFREFVVTIPNVALFIGTTTGFTISGGNTIVTDSSANFGPTNGLVGNYLLPNQGEVNDLFLIIANTSNTITVQGIVNNREVGGNYAVLSPLNTNRFIILNKLLPIYIPFGTQAGFMFL